MLLLFPATTLVPVPFIPPHFTHSEPHCGPEKTLRQKLLPHLAFSPLFLDNSYSSSDCPLIYLPQEAYSASPRPLRTLSTLALNIPLPHLWPCEPVNIIRVHALFIYCEPPWHRVMSGSDVKMGFMKYHPMTKLLASIQQTYQRYTALL